jgi:hypothetical protein
MREKQCSETQKRSSARLGYFLAGLAILLVASACGAPNGIYFVANRRAPPFLFFLRWVWRLLRSASVWRNNGIVWTHEVTADEETLLHRLKKLPCTFMVSADLLRAILPMVEAKGLANVEYSYIGHLEYDWRPENNTPEQLGPQWDWSRPKDDGPYHMSQIGPDA